MDTIRKLQILSQDSQYDLACACGTNDKDRRHRGADGKWLYPVPLPQGGTCVLLKTLLSNACTNDCKYCPLRSDSNVRRCTLDPEEVARLFLDYQRRENVMGLFLSSGVVRDADYTMDRVNAVARTLRKKHRFKGYIHLKIIPGASDAAIEDSLSLASAVSLNIETPGKSHFERLSQRKDYMQDIIRPLKLIGEWTGRGQRHSRVKATTQFIVGASDETDREIVRYMFGLYKRLAFERVYFSAYQMGLGAPDLPGEQRFGLNGSDMLVREHRLYQADFLIRKYGFGEEDVLFEGDGNLSLTKDPKEQWADRHQEFFPVRLNSAPREALLRVPGIGPVTAKRIIEARRHRRVDRLQTVGMKGKLLEKAARYVIFE